MTLSRTLSGLCGLALLLGAAPAAAQDDEGLSFRPFVMVSQQRFAAEQTFNAAFDTRSETFFGGGLNITQDNRFYLDVSASHFSQTGQRAFLNNGQAFRVGIPLKVEMTPVEFTAGYRFLQWRRVIPYLGAGAGLYKYKESSPFSTADENVDAHHAGAIFEGGVELRLHRWFGIGADVHYTYVPGILGSAGLSQQANEKDLGGIAARFRAVVGK